MKKLLSLCLLYSITAFGQKDAKAPLKMEGVYSMTMQMINNGFKDEILPTKQLKIYNGRYFMYAAPVSPTDSLASFGIGKYHIANGKLMEYILFTASTGEVKDSAMLTIKKSPKGYKQVIVYPPFQDTVYTLTEEYDKVDKAIMSPMDGTWKLSKSYYIKSIGDTAINNVTQFKIYYGGHFIWGAGFLDSASNKNKGFFGYGSFKMTGAKLTETNTNSTFISDLIDKPVLIDIKFIGKDSYMQTISNPAGGKSVEVYKRMK